MQPVIRILFSLLILAATSVMAEGPSKFSSGFKGGTYDSMAQALKKAGVIDMQVETSSGSIENIDRVKNGQADFAIVQIDVLLNQYKKESDLRSKVAMVMPLFSEEIHLLSTKDITSFDQLRGKTIAAGQKGSGTLATAYILLEAFNIPPSEVKFLYSSPAESLKAVTGGQADAMLLVSGAPVELLTSVNQAQGQNLHLVSLGGETFKKLDRFYHYQPTAIPSNTYSFEAADKITVSVANVIICRRKLKFNQVASFINSVFDKKDELAKSHTKWQELDLKKMTYYMAGQTMSFHSAALQTLADRLKKSR